MQGDEFLLHYLGSYVCLESSQIKPKYQALQFEEYY